MTKRQILKPIKLFGCVDIHLSVILLFCIAVALDFHGLLLITYIIVLIHELAHFLAAKALGVKADRLIIMPFGVTMRLKNATISSPEDELKIAAAGPMSNVVMAFLAAALGKLSVIAYDTSCYLTILNFGIAFVNIIPAMPLDGGRILKAYLTLRVGCIRAYNAVMLVTKITAAIVILCGIAFMFITGFNFSFFMIGAFLIANTLSEQRGKSLVIMREILYSREKLKEMGAKNSGVITVMADTPARNVLKIFTYNKYYTINIVDDDMNIIGTVTETKLIHSLIDKGIRIKAKETLW